MRFFLPLVIGIVLVIGAGSGCGSGVASSSDGGSADGSSEGAAGDSAANDSALTDGSTGDSGIACSLLGGAYDKACGTASDCTMVARGCYCGAQPVIGVAKSSAAAAQACETKAQNDCALGCANFPGRVAEDGNNDVDGGTIEVRCDNSSCHTILR